MGWFDDDICWCGNSNLKGEKGCDRIECFRHLSNRKPQARPDIFTCGSLKNTPDCPYYKEKEKCSEK